MLENSQVMEEVVNSFNPVEETPIRQSPLASLVPGQRLWIAAHRIQKMFRNRKPFALIKIDYEEEDDQRIFEFTDGTLTRLVNHSNLIDFCKLFPLPPPPILTHTPYYF